jgi:hypothetical protein
VATSGSYDFSINTLEIITEALEYIGFLAAGETAEAEDVVTARRTLNLLIKTWMGPNNQLMPGLKVWQRERGSLTLDATKAEYSLKPSGGDCDIQIPVKILTASLRNSSSQDTPLRMMNLAEYESIGNKSASGDPTAIYYERRLTEGKLYTNVKPSDATKTIRFVYLQPLEDVDANTNDLDFPPEYLLPIAHQLGLNLAPKFDLPLTDVHVAVAQSSAALVQTFEPETVNAYFEPDKDQ